MQYMMLETQPTSSGAYGPIAVVRLPKWRNHLVLSSTGTAIQTCTGVLMLL
jgi:hypothetical protein